MIQGLKGYIALVSSSEYYLTLILHCYWWKFRSHDTEVSIILFIIATKKSNLFKLKWSVPKMFRLHWVIVIFRFVVYLLNMICFLPHTIYASFGITLTQFSFNFSRQEHQIELIKVMINS